MTAVEAKVTNQASLRIGLCQVLTEEWAVEDNLRRTLEAIQSAAGQGAEIAVTPECVLHGYARNDGPSYCERLLAAAEPLDGERLRQVRDTARALGISVLLGFAERGEGDSIHNSAALIAATGEIIYVYRKVHCRPFESIRHQGLFVPGDRFHTANLSISGRRVQVGTMICFDREVPESVRCLRSLGAEVVLCPLATDTFDALHPGECADNELITRCRAAENEVIIVVVNHAGRFNGGSFAVGPRGQILHQMGSEPGVHVLDVPIGAVATQYHDKPLGWMGWGHRRPEVYRQYLDPD